MAIETTIDLYEQGVNTRSLTKPDIYTTTPMGRALFGIAAGARSAPRRHDPGQHEARPGGRPPVMRPERAAALAQDDDGSLTPAS